MNEAMIERMTKPVTKPMTPPVTHLLVRRGLGMVLCGVTAMLLLTGCFTLRMDLTIAPDDTVDGSVVLAVDNSLVELAGGEDALVESLTSGDSALFSEAPPAGEVTTKTYRDDARTGVEYTLTDVPLAEFDGGGDQDLSITRVDDTYVVDGALDLSQDLDDSAAGAEDLLASAEVSLSVTFPGEVIETNGEVSGTTVTWAPKAGEVVQLQATGNAGSGFPVALVAGLGLLGLFLVVSLVMWLVVRPR